MAIQLAGSTGSVAEVDSTFQAVRASLRPEQSINWNSLAGVSGNLTGVAANGPVFSFRNIGSSLMLFHRVLVSFTTTTAFTTAQAVQYNLIKATGFTASDSSGTSLFTSGQNKHRTSMANPATAPDIRISSTGVLTAGTRTLETQPIGAANAWSGGAGSTLPQTQLLSHDAGDYPFVLAQNEGLIITNAVAMGAAGVGTLIVNIEWSEANSY
jgi:hypothetical protein